MYMKLTEALFFNLMKQFLKGLCLNFIYDLETYLKDIICLTFSVVLS